MAGLAERDPEQIWDAVPDRLEVESFAGLWGRSEPEEALAFFESKLGDDSNRRHASELVLALLPTHPEEAVSFLSRLGELDQSVANTNSSVLLGESTQWPVVEGMRPGIPMDELKRRVEQAMEDHAIERDVRMRVMGALGLAE